MVEGFGSFIMDLFISESDLDLSINFGRPEVELPREKKIETLKKFSKKLHFLQSNSARYSVNYFLIKIVVKQFPTIYAQYACLS